MRRTKLLKEPTAILTSDWHLREDSPTCFTGDWYHEQWEAVQTVFDLQAKYNCPVIHAGDLFHHWKPSPNLLSQTLFFLPKKFYTIYGQHDLPQHSWELRDKTGLHTLEAAGRLTVLTECHYGKTPVKGSLFFPGSEVTILVWHYLTYIKAPFPGAKEGMAEGLLRKYPQYDLIVTGDNHQSFQTEYKGRHLVNPGSLTRQKADQINFEPKVYLWYIEEGVILSVPIPYTEGSISREHLDVKEKRDNRYEAFVTRIDDDWEVEMSFETNLETYYTTNPTRESVKQIIYKATEK